MWILTNNIKDKLGQKNFNTINNYSLFYTAFYHVVVFNFPVLRFDSPLLLCLLCRLFLRFLFLLFDFLSLFFLAFFLFRLFLLCLSSRLFFFSSFLSFRRRLRMSNSPSGYLLAPLCSVATIPQAPLCLTRMRLPSVHDATLMWQRDWYVLSSLPQTCLLLRLHMNKFGQVHNGRPCMFSIQTFIFGHFTCSHAPPANK